MDLTSQLPAIASAIVAMAGAIGQAMQGSEGQQPAQQQGGKHCPNCNALNPADARFCSNCGKRLDDKKTCPNCQAENAADAKFCSDCGNKLD